MIIFIQHLTKLFNALISIDEHINVSYGRSVIVSFSILELSLAGCSTAFASSQLFTASSFTFSTPELIVLLISLCRLSKKLKDTFLLPKTVVGPKVTFLFCLNCASGSLVCFLFVLLYLINRLFLTKKLLLSAVSDICDFLGVLGWSFPSNCFY